MSIHTAIGDPWSRSVIMDSLREAAEVSGRTVSELISVKRDLLTAQARQAAMWQAHKRGVSHSAMARFFKKDHTTVMYAIKAAERRSREYAALEEIPVFKTTRNTQ